MFSVLGVKGDVILGFFETGGKTGEAGRLSLFGEIFGIGKTDWEFLLSLPMFTRLLGEGVTGAF